MTTLKEDLEALMLEADMERVQRYRQEGRQFKTLNGGDLRSEWISAFKKLAANPILESRKLIDDLQAEMVIRGIQPPVDEVKTEAEAFIACIARGMKEADPAQWAEINEELEADIRAMKRRRETSARN